MMRSTKSIWSSISIMVLLLLAGEIYGRSAPTVYVNENFNRVSEKDAVAYSKEAMLTKSGERVFVSMAGYDTLFICGWKNGKRHGAFKAFSVEGLVLESGNFKHGKKINWYTYYQYPEKPFRGVYYNWLHKVRAEYYIDPQGRKIYTKADRNSRFGRHLSEQKAVESLGAYVDENIERPPVARELDNPTVMVHFIIRPDGTIGDVQLEGSTHPDLDAAILKLMKDMPAWTPARFKGENVFSEFYLSVSF